MLGRNARAILVPILQRGGALKGVNAEIKNTQESALGCRKALKTGSRQHLSLLCTEAEAPSSAVSETKEKLATLKTWRRAGKSGTLRMVTFPKNSTMLFSGEIIETEEDLKSWRHRQISLPLLCRRLLLLVKAWNPQAIRFPSAGEKPFLPLLQLQLWHCFA